VIIAPSFADIFFNNCFKIGLLAVVLDPGVVDKLFQEVDAAEGYRLLVDLETQSVRTASGESFFFEIDPFRKYSLLNGLDEIGLTMQHAEQIAAFEATHAASQPWLFQ
jgi:3-isopropylmalate/(R)-2-methylmalate dehydratase small subunit